MLKTELVIIEMEEVQAAKDFNSCPELTFAELEEFIIISQPCLKCGSGEYNENYQEQ